MANASQLEDKALTITVLDRDRISTIIVLARQMASGPGTCKRGAPCDLPANNAGYGLLAINYILHYIMYTFIKCKPYLRKRCYNLATTWKIVIEKIFI